MYGNESSLKSRFVGTDYPNVYASDNNDNNNNISKNNITNLTTAGGSVVNDPESVLNRKAFNSQLNSSNCNVHVNKVHAEYIFTVHRTDTTNENVYDNTTFTQSTYATHRSMCDSTANLFHSFEVPSTSGNIKFGHQITALTTLKMCSGIFLKYICYIVSLLLRRRTFHLLLIVFLYVSRVEQCNTLLITKPEFSALTDIGSYRRVDNVNYEITNNMSSVPHAVVNYSGATAGTGGYFDKPDNLERSVKAVFLKVAYGTTSTTKRSLPNANYVPGLTTIATPILTTMRYLEKSSQHQQINVHHRNYELDLERDHALPTSAPNADILKSNSNSAYPNPNRPYIHERSMLNSTPMPSLPNVMKKNNGQTPTIPMYPLDVPSYSPPARSFFTPPLPPEYQNPFADKPTLRGTNNEGIVANTGTYINRRPIPPPSLMPGHERIPFRPPDLAASTGGGNGSKNSASNSFSMNPIVGPNTMPDIDRKNVLNTPSHGNDSISSSNESKKGDDSNRNASPVQDSSNVLSNMHKTRKEPGIRRILSGDIPEVLLKQATIRPAIFYHQPPSSPIVLVDNSSQISSNDANGLSSSSNINISIKSEKGIKNSTNPLSSEEKNTQKISNTDDNIVQSDGDGAGDNISSTPSAAAVGEGSGTSSTTSTASTLHSNVPTLPSLSPSSSATSATTSSVEQSTWAIAWNIHVYLSVILFTILAVYSFYKLLTYNKLTHLFSQSYFVCINVTLLIICTSRIFYLCYDAYNIHSSFHIFVSEILLNLPATFLTISFSVLILFLFLKSLNHKNNRYSALIRPLTVIVGCGVHVVLCITLHYVESYTMQNHQQHLYYQQQMYRRQQQQSHYLQQQFVSTNLPVNPNQPSTTSSIANSSPPRVLSLICQIIYIFVCFSLGLLYLYLYRMLKRILRSKSQNYIHGLQNLSYAIHITIAIALLFVLLAALQIFGAISISTTRPLVTQPTLEIDWLQWGYQFSLRLIEIAIITLISWVTGLKTSGGNVNIGMVSADSRLDNGTTGSGVFGSGAGVNSREKHGHHHHHHHSNVAGFFLPCTSTSSQEQFDTDYPAICNANTNLHTYTMRTGKLIYDDNFALNSLTGQSSHLASGGGGVGTGRSGEYHAPQPTYHRPYDTGSMQGSSNQSKTDYAVTQGNRYQQPQDMHQYADYLTDATTDHYENPNFDLRTNGSCHTNHKYGKTSTSAAGASMPRKQMVLVQNDTCYSEPLSQNFDHSKLVNQDTLENWSERNPPQPPHPRPIDKWGKKSHAVLDRSTYENAERRSSNSTHSCTSSMGGRNIGYTSFERGPYNCVRKSGTLNNIDDGAGGPIYGRNSSSSSVTSSNISGAAHRAGVGYGDRHHFHHPPQIEPKIEPSNGGRIGRVIGDPVASADCATHEVFGRSSLERHIQQHLYEHPHNSDDDIMLSSSNVERTNLIQNNEDGSCSRNSNVKSDLSKSEQMIRADSNAGHLPTNSNSIAFEEKDKILMNHSNTSSGLDSASSTISGTSSSVTESANSGSMLVAENGFVRFRALDDINNAQGVGIHNASIRKQNRQNASVSSATAAVMQSS